MRTKWEIQEQRRLDLLRQVKEIEDHQEWAAKTFLVSKCDGCGKMLETEKDFEQHFVIPNEDYLNLGNCPDKA